MFNITIWRMKLFPSGKDRLIYLKTFSGICGNLSAGWIGFVIIAPGISPPLTLDNTLTLTRSLAAGIVFAYFAYRLERISK